MKYERERCGYRGVSRKGDAIRGRVWVTDHAGFGPSSIHEDACYDYGNGYHHGGYARTGVLGGSGNDGVPDCVHTVLLEQRF